MTQRQRLGVNIDHVATIRNARGGPTPDPIRAAHVAAAAGADGITAHLREDRRHISDGDIARLSQEIQLPLNLEMAMTDEMRDVALKWKPHAVCIVPERREERTTEGGLDAAGEIDALRELTARLTDNGSRVSLFIEAQSRQIEAAAAVGAAVVEFHTGAYCNAHAASDAATCETVLAQIRTGVEQATALGLEVHAGHGLTFDTVTPFAAMTEIAELNIGHFLVGEAIFVGLSDAIKEMRACMDAARAGASA